MATRPETPLLIAGPTASGKSALALVRAKRDGGIVINADSMQVYADLAILTARPSHAETAEAPHRLYGHVPAAETYSVARWLEDVRAVLDEALSLRARPIIVGGTGLYFKALLEGLSPVPPIPAEIRLRWREAALAAEPGDLHRRLAECDPLMAVRLAPGDTQRITRALEVFAATGRSLADWQREPGRPLIDAINTERNVVSLPRETLRHRCDRRFDLMMAAGALDEVRNLLGQRLASDLPAMRALGVGPLAAYLAGTMTCEEAVARAKLETHQYVKRQETWLKRQMSDWTRVESRE